MEAPSAVLNLQAFAMLAVGLIGMFAYRRRTSV